MVRKLGLDVERPPVAGGSRHPELIAGDDKCVKLGCLVLELMRSLLASWAVEQVEPYLFAKLLLPEHGDIMRVVKGDWEGFQEAKKWADRNHSWKNFVAHSIFNTRFTEKVCRMLVDADWQMTRELQEQLMSTFEAFGQSNVIELGVNVSKSSADRSRNYSIIG
eukprot:6088965-Amphidinium_carterae.3